MEIPELAQDLAYFIQTHNLNNIYLLGHSLGGRVVMSFLKNYEDAYERIKGAVIVDILPDSYYKMNNTTTMETYVALQ